MPKKSSLALGLQGARRATLSENVNSLQTFQEQQLLVTAIENQHESLLRIQDTLHEGFKAIKEVLHEIRSKPTPTTIPDPSPSLQNCTTLLEEIRTSTRKLIQSAELKCETEAQEAMISSSRHLALNSALHLLQEKVLEVFSGVSSVSKQVEGTTRQSRNDDVATSLKTLVELMQAQLGKLWQEQATELSMEIKEATRGQKELLEKMESVRSLSTPSATSTDSENPDTSSKRQENPHLASESNFSPTSYDEDAFLASLPSSSSIGTDLPDPRLSSSSIAHYVRESQQERHGNVVKTSSKHAPLSSPSFHSHLEQWLSSFVSPSHAISKSQMEADYPVEVTIELVEDDESGIGSTSQKEGPMTSFSESETSEYLGDCIFQRRERSWMEMEATEGKEDWFRDLDMFGSSSPHMHNVDIESLQGVQNGDGSHRLGPMERTTRTNGLAHTTVTASTLPPAGRLSESIKKSRKKRIMTKKAHRINNKKQCSCNVASTSASPPSLSTAASPGLTCDVDARTRMSDGIIMTRAQRRRAGLEL